MPLLVPLQLTEEMPPVNKETCLNFIHFRNILKANRSKCDGKIKQRLSSITNPKEQCKKFENNLRSAQESRIKNLKFCLQVLKEGLNASNSVLQKEVKHLLCNLILNIYFAYTGAIIGIGIDCRRNRL